MITSWKVKRVVTIVGKQKKRVTAWEVSTSWEETEESFIGVEDAKEKSDYKLRRDYK